MIWLLFQLIIWWVSFFCFPLSSWFLAQAIGGFGWWYWVLFVLSLIFVYSRFVEPNLLKVRREKFIFKNGGIPLKAVLISDLHLGVFKGKVFLERVLKIIRKIQPEIVFIPGDLINDPTQKELSEFFKPLGQLGCPVLVVTGNHDSRKPGMFESEKVREAARAAGLITIDNDSYLFKKGPLELEVFGLSDLMEGKIDFNVLNGGKVGRSNLILAHNPDTAHCLSEKLSSKFPLILSGHTHAGQIQIPFLYKLVIPTKYSFVNGWYKIRGKSLFISSGLGEVILPMRLGVIPEIVVLDLMV